MKTSTFSLIFLLLHSVSFSQSLSRKLIDRMDIVKTMGVIEESVQEEDTGKVIYLNFEDDSFSKQMQGAQRRSDSFLESFWDEDEDVPWFGLFLFSDFLNPIEADTLASERILSEWNQFMLCGGVSCCIDGLLHKKRSRRFVDSHSVSGRSFFSIIWQTLLER